MRYLSLVFFIFLSLHSYFVFADDAPETPTEPVCHGARTSTQICSAQAGQYCGSNGFVSNPNNQSCGNQTFGYGTSGYCYRSCDCKDGKTLQAGFCKCPTGSNWNSEINSCIDEPIDGGDDPDECPAPNVKNIDTGACEPKTECTFPQQWDYYSNSCTSNPNSCAIGCTANPLIPGDCMCDGEPSCPAGWALTVTGSSCYPTGASSAPTSSPAASSTPTSAPPTSTPSNPSSTPSGGGGGDDGGGDTPGGGGDDDGGGNTPGGGGPGGGNGGNNGGGASSAASSSGSGGGSASSGGASGSASSGSGSGSGGNSSEGNGTGGETCDDKPVCSMEDIQCNQLIQQWHTRCGGEKLDSKFWELPDQGDDKASFEKSLKTFKEELEKLPNTAALTDFFKFSSSGSCPIWRASVWVFDVVIDQQCSSTIPWNLISGIVIAIAALAAARIAFT
jgi:uncharacterized membrane protein YgcG